MMYTVSQKTGPLLFLL